jgi:hypothetical protein
MQESIYSRSQTTIYDLHHTNDSIAEAYSVLCSCKMLTTLLIPISTTKIEIHHCLTKRQIDQAFQKEIFMKNVYDNKRNVLRTAFQIVTNSKIQIPTFVVIKPRSTVFNIDTHDITNISTNIRIRLLQTFLTINGALVNTRVCVYNSHSSNQQTNHVLLSTQVFLEHKHSKRHSLRLSLQSNCLSERKTI